MSVRVASEWQPAWDPSRLLSKIKKLLETQSIAKLNFAVTVIMDTEKEVFYVCDNVGIRVRVCVSIINISTFHTFIHLHITHSHIHNIGYRSQSIGSR